MPGHGNHFFSGAGMAFGTPLVMRLVSLPPPERRAQLAEKTHSCSFPPEGDGQGAGTRDLPSEVTRSQAGNLGLRPAIGGFRQAIRGQRLVTLNFDIRGKMPRIHQHALFRTGPLNSFLEKVKCWGVNWFGDQEETVGFPPLHPPFSHVAEGSGRLSAATWRLLLPDWEAPSALSSATVLGGCARPVWGNRAEAPVNASYLCGPCKHSFLRILKSKGKMC
ncbi:hypothetical protein NN561_015625 [Cricetulus griseus]